MIKILEMEETETTRNHITISPPKIATVETHTITKLWESHHKKMDKLHLTLMVTLENSSVIRKNPN